MNEQDTGPPMPWPGPSGYEGIPWKGPPVHMRQDDPPHLQPKVNYIPHVRIFDLADEADIQEYTEILHRVTLGECVVGHEDIRFDQKTGAWKSLLRWYDQFLTAPHIKVKSNGRTVWDGENGST